MEIENEIRRQSAQPIGPEQLKQFDRILKDYHDGKRHTERRIIDAEQWWKMRNTAEEQKQTEVGKDRGFTAQSGWLHNVIVSKHADAMESFPEPNILPREEGDKGEASILSDIIPCILEKNNFEETYSDVMWQKLKTGTGCYKVVWDKNLLNGLGDIRVERVNLLNLFWEPGITKIQNSRYVFHVELADKDLLKQQFPQLEGKLKNTAETLTAKFLYDDSVKTDNNAAVIEVYYHKVNGDGKKVLHYVKYVGDEVLFATENDTAPMRDAMGNVIAEPMASTGLYDHGEFPYVFDALYPIEGSPCGYGFVDLCKNPQIQIDMIKTAITKNAMAGATPRYFAAQNGNVNEDEFLDLSKPIVHTSGNVDELSLRRIEHNSLDGMYVNVLEQNIQELRETSGNTETANGATPSGITAASAIAALQEASGKGSRDSTQTSYRAYQEIVNLCIELVRQFYGMPRQFRIVGEYGMQKFISYSNKGIQPQQQIGPGGMDMGMRLPVFDIKVSAQRRNAYTKMSNNEMALQFFQMGFFNPQMADQALICLEIMDFDGKDGIMQKISQQAMLQQKLVMYMQMVMGMAQQLGDMQTAQMAANDLAMTTGMAPMQMGGMAAGRPGLPESDAQTGGMQRDEPTIVSRARERSANASQPTGG